MLRAFLTPFPRFENIVVELEYWDYYDFHLEILPARIIMDASIGRVSVDILTIRNSRILRGNSRRDKQLENKSLGRGSPRILSPTSGT